MIQDNRDELDFDTSSAACVEHGAALPLLCLGPSRAASRRRASAGNDWTPSKPAKIFRENPNCQLTSCCGARGSPQVPLQVLANALGPPLGPRLGRLALLGLARCWPSMHPCALHSATAKSASQLMFGDCCHELMENGSEASRRSHSQSQQGGAWCAATTVGPDQNTRTIQCRRTEEM
jgi:hypothetical protein